jgi:kynurenine formamidase
MDIQYKYLSHILDNDTPTYGNEYNISITFSHDMQKGAIANESSILTTTHIGTHIDLPYHFFKEGQTIEAYDASFWIFEHPLVIEINQEKEIIKDELIHALEQYKHQKNIDFIMVKTGIEKIRKNKKFWAENPGFDPDLYNYLVDTFPKVRAFGFDSISLSSYKHPLVGRKAHQAFLNPAYPIIVIEDMHLSEISTSENILQVIIAPLRISKCDGMPCTVIAAIGC